MKSNIECPARHSSNTNVGFSCRVLSWLLHHANREGRNEYFYKIKNQLLSKYGNFIGYDVQFIEGKKCHSCGGTGIYQGYSWRYQDYEDVCYRCYNGWYKRPTWNVLQRIQFGNYVFHQPFERLYKKPEEISLPIIEGYIDHNRSKHGKFALTALFLLYEKGYLKRWYKSAGMGWRCYWWQPRNWLYNIVHIIKHGRNSIPFNDTKAKMKAIISKYKSVKPVSYEPDDLPLLPMTGLDLAKYLKQYKTIESVNFGKWLDKLLPSQRCTVHSDLSTGLFDKTMEQLYADFKKEQNEKHT